LQFPGNGFAEAQAAIRSVRDPWERRELIGYVKFYFQAMRQERGTAVKWQDYVASVKACVATLTKPEVA